MTTKTRIPVVLRFQCGHTRETAYKSPYPEHIARQIAAWLAKKAATRLCKECRTAQDAILTPVPAETTQTAAPVVPNGSRAKQTPPVRADAPERPTAEYWRNLEAFVVGGGQPYPGYTVSKDEQDRWVIKCDGCTLSYVAHLRMFPRPADLYNHDYDCTQFYNPEDYDATGLATQRNYYATTCKSCNGKSGRLVGHMIGRGKYAFPVIPHSVYHVRGCRLFVEHYRVRRPSIEPGYSVKNENLTTGNATIECDECKATKEINARIDESPKMMRHAPACSLHPTKRRTKTK